MTTWVISRFNHKISWLNDYLKPEDKVVLYDRSENPLFLFDWKHVENKGSDIYDKFTWIIDNYTNLPETSILLKCNIFDYIKPREFEKIKDNTTFTPILSQEHHTYMPVSYYKDGMYYEINNYWYLNAHPAKYAKEIIEFTGMDRREYNAFAPGSNYIVPKENILQYSKKIYKKLRSYLDWDVYPGDAQLIERNLYYLWK